MTTVAPIAIRTGFAMPVGMMQAARRDRDVVLLGVLLREALGPRVAVRDPDRAERTAAAEDAERDVGPHRPDREAVLAAAAGGWRTGCR